MNASSVRIYRRFRAGWAKSFFGTKVSWTVSDLHNHLLSRNSTEVYKARTQAEAIKKVGGQLSLAEELVREWTEAGLIHVRPSTTEVGKRSLICASFLFKRVKKWGNWTPVQIRKHKKWIKASYKAYPQKVIQDLR